MIAPGEEPQALPGLVQQFRLRQDAAADRDHGIGGDNEGAAQFLVQPHRFERRLRLGAGKPRGAGARQFALVGDFVDIRGLQGIRLDAGLVDQGEPAGRTGSENEFGPADHGWCAVRGLPG